MGGNRTVTVVETVEDGPTTVRDDRGRTFHVVAYGSERVREALSNRNPGEWLRLRLRPAGSRPDVCVATALFPEVDSVTGAV